MSPPLLCSTSFAYVSILFFTIDNTCENITSAVTALITRQMICSRPDRVLTIRNVRGSTRLSNDIRFVHFTLRILQIRTKLYKLLFINKQFGPQSNVIAQKSSRKTQIHVSDNQGQKQLTHLFKTGAFNKHLIHLLFHSF